MKEVEQHSPCIVFVRDSEKILGSEERTLAVQQALEYAVFPHAVICTCIKDVLHLIETSFIHAYIRRSQGITR